MGTIPASVARQTLPAQLDAVEQGAEVAITRHGKVVAVLVHPDRLRSARASEVWHQADHINELLTQAREAPVHDPALDTEQADALIADIYAQRDAQ